MKISWRQSHVLKSGFALVVTLSMMILLVIVAVGMLGLSTIALRTTAIGSAETRARDNARMALMLAIDRLQTELGPDQRISANSEITAEPDESVIHKNWTGSWNSWVAGGASNSSHSTIGNASIGIAPTYETNREDMFRSWLVSIDPELQSDINAPASLTLTTREIPDRDSTGVLLVGEGSLGEEADGSDYVQVPLINLKSDLDNDLTVGRYGWWVGDESQKAMVMSDSFAKQEELTLAERMFRVQAAASTGTAAVPGLNDLTDDTELDRVMTRKTFELVEGGEGADASGDRQELIKSQFHAITNHSYGLFTDVREGGMKRCLNTILERPIDPEEVYEMQTAYGNRGGGFLRANSLTEDGEDFMLYSFDNMVSRRNGNTGEASVPIQDLAAYYQLYDSERDEWNDTTDDVTDGWRNGIQYSSSQSQPSNNLIGSGFMISNPCHGFNRGDYNNYFRGYTSQYRTPVPIKLEYIIHYCAEAVTPAPAAGEDRYELRFGFSPAITLWNPYNVPMVMNIGNNPEMATIMLREHPPGINLRISKSSSYDGAAEDTVNYTFNRITNTQQGELYTVFISGRSPVIFEPGEAKVFSLQFSSQTTPGVGLNEIDMALRGRIGGRYSEPFIPELELVPGWNPDKFIKPVNTQGGRGRNDGVVMTFDTGDFISAEVSANGGGSFSCDFSQKSRHGRNLVGVKWEFRAWRIAGRIFEGRGGSSAFNRDMVHMGFPPTSGIANTDPRTVRILTRRGNNIIAAMRNPYDPRDDLPQAIFYYAMKAGVETHESNQATYAIGGGRRFPARPFLHSAALNPLFMDNLQGSSLYNYGWSWFFNSVNNVQDAPVSISRDSHGYHGGGYTAENGTTHVVQQHLPITPPISLASLKNAKLSGYSLGTEQPWTYDRFPPSLFRVEGYIRNTALGYGGLQPYMVQAIGNSYAHPNIPPDQALTTWTRNYYQTGRNLSTNIEPFVDHSYLANKALWDEYFFSSIFPKRGDIPPFESGDISAEDVTRQFFFEGVPLPNRRIVPYYNGLDEDKLEQLLLQYTEFKDGFADKIAAHLMVKGPFNINSTSVDAWRTLFSSLKGKPISVLDKDDAVRAGLNMDEEVVDGVPIANGAFANEDVYRGSRNDPSDEEQWAGIRELTDEEINELATAMVKQVKLRGPFLSLSDFVNRRLDRSNTELALKGALQAALDDPECSINDGFRGGSRQFSAAERSYVNAEFPEAMEGAVAYGSPAYIDQADILENFGAQLTARGDTFVIRAYGDALDNRGNVEARAWCEAIVQRTPDYLDAADANYLKQDELTSERNQNFGRKFTILQFRWLNASEI